MDGRFLNLPSSNQVVKFLLAVVAVSALVGGAVVGGIVWLVMR